VLARKSAPTIKAWRLRPCEDPRVAELRGGTYVPAVGAVVRTIETFGE
jgi:hypothetical protein